ncbi:MAG: hypothetical protein HQM10_10080 [Candidatus Riflebacteria bacterium]|nr:hypothetical protein [Candidatus Riflebacteria bacterium]
MHIKKYGSIIRTDREKFLLTLDTMTVDISPDPTQPGCVIVINTGKAPDGSPLPPDPMTGKISVAGTTPSIKTDDGSWTKMEYRKDGTYKFTSSKMPVTVVAKYID